MIPEPKSSFRIATSVGHPASGVGRRTRAGVEEMELPGSTSLYRSGVKIAAACTNFVLYNPDQETKNNLKKKDIVSMKHSALDFRCTQAPSRQGYAYCIAYIHHHSTAKWRGEKSRFGKGKAFNGSEDDKAGMNGNCILYSSHHSRRLLVTPSSVEHAPEGTLEHGTIHEYIHLGRVLRCLHHYF